MPLLSKAKDAQVANYVFSLMNAIDALSCTTLVTTGEPNSTQANRIVELIEDAAAGVFSTSATPAKEGQPRMFWVHKMVNVMTPPTSYKIQHEYGTGIVQDLGPRNEEVRIQGDRTPKQIATHDLPLRIALIDNDEDSAAQFEEIFSKAQSIEMLEDEEDFIHHHRKTPYDLLVVNSMQAHGNWFLTVHQLREEFEKLPIFLIAPQQTAQLTYQSAKLAGADALFIQPLVTIDVVKALEKALKNYEKYQEIVNRLTIESPLANLPEDFTNLVSSVFDEESLSQRAESLISFADFKEKLHEQIWRCSQKNQSFALVSFRMINTGEISKTVQLPRGLEMVKKLSAIVGHSMRGLNDNICRSMDKIVVMLENCDREGGDIFVARVTADVKSELCDKLGIQLGKHLIVSKALAIYPEDADNVQDLLMRVTETSRNFKLIH